jgi:hypothetical protein
LEFRREGIPLHYNRRAQASKNMLFFSGEIGVGPWLLAWRMNHLVEIVRQPFFVISKCAEAVLRILKIANLTWIVRAFNEFAIFAVNTCASILTLGDGSNP